ncbi:endolytic transglycosylase MltG [uncultured Sphaerotilus sp.]|uniref:endolytic transglycosylase MltG n=1 Tax=uncultured Sphaerotilus sp. TaxID=474984 RepID=UPI0030CA136E
MASGRRSTPGRATLWLGTGLLLLASLLAGCYWWIQHPMGGPETSVDLEVESGESARQVAQATADAGMAVSPWMLYQWFRWSGQSRQIRAGSYEIQPGTSPAQLLRKLVDGDQSLARLRLIEGWTFRQVRAELARMTTLRAESATLSDTELMAAIGSPGLLPEGRFFPDTYAYAKGSSDLAVLRRAHAAMRKRVDAAWSQREADSPLKSADELLTLASIVEKETGRAEDRPMVASVFVNRLRVRMPLQTDPTVIYGLGERFDGNLRRKDLLADTPYNTYTRAGLPPTPIAMPGRDSLMAAVRPASSKALYFVARGDGTSQFSETLADHNRAVDKYQRKAAR